MINGRAEQASGLSVQNYLDNPLLRLAPSDRRARTNTEAERIHIVVLHTTKGIPGGHDLRSQEIRPGFGPSNRAGERVVGSWTHDTATHAGAHLVVDFDGRIYCCADLGAEAAYHARHANGVSIGVEIFQGRNAELYEGQLGITVLLVDWLTARFGIQRQIPYRYAGPISGPRDLTRDVSSAVGVFGHRDLTGNRGAGDPGSRIFNMLGAAGYEPFNFALNEDREEWARRQRKLGVEHADGIPGPKTREALVAHGYERGLWVQRPGDAQ